MEASQREGRWWKPLCGRFGTCLGVLRETGVSDGDRRILTEVEAQRMPALAALEEDAEASIRVVPPSFRSLTGAGNSAFFIE